jgi:phytoene desaturase
MPDTTVPRENKSLGRVAVIGSGFGGLAAAIRLQAAGVATTIFETRDRPGGRAYVYEDQGFVFDAGPTVITAPELLHELWALAGRSFAEDVELMPVTPFYRLVWSDGDQMDYCGDGPQMIEQIRKRNPSDAEGYERFVAYSKKVYEKGYVELAHVPFLRFADMLRCAPELAKLRADRSVYNTVARFVKDEHTRQALSFHSLLVGGNPFDTSSIYTLIHYLERQGGVWFPRGGTGALVRALVRLFESLGGEIRLSSPVRSIEVATEAGLTTHLVSTDGRAHERFDGVVSNADLHHTYDKLYATTPSAQAYARKLERKEWSMGLFVLYFGTDKPFDIAHHTVLFGPRYKGLLDEIFQGSALPDDFSLYLHAPTVTDPSLAPPGCGTFYVLSPVPHLGNAPIDWDREGAPYAEKILASLETLMPDLRKHVVTKRWMTPNDFKTELVAHHGSAFSLAPKLTQSAWFRPHNRDAHIPGLYIVGAGTHPGAGVPGVISSAKATSACVLDDLRARPRPNRALPAEAAE